MTPDADRYRTSLAVAESFDGTPHVIVAPQHRPVGEAAQRAVAKIYTTGRNVDDSLAGPTRYDTAAAVANPVVRECR